MHDHERHGRGSGPDENPGASIRIHRLGRVASTQDAVRELAAAEDLDRAAVAADEQTGGRGRLGRAWRTVPGGAVAVSLAHRIALPPTARGWTVHAAGIAVHGAVLAHLSAQADGDAARPAERDSARVGLKWPNDLLDAEDRKLAGILVEVAGEHLIIGVGLNLAGPVLDEDGAPIETAGWLHGDGGLLPALEPGALQEHRRTLEQRIVDGLCTELAALEPHGGDAVASGLAARYRMNCITLGRDVVVHPLGGGPVVPGGAQAITGRAVDRSEGVV